MRAFATSILSQKVFDKYCSRGLFAARSERVLWQLLNCLLLHFRPSIFYRKTSRKRGGGMNPPLLNMFLTYIQINLYITATYLQQKLITYLIF